MIQTETSGIIRLHPANPRYFSYKGNPLVLITSTEHYGAVSNAAFDYVEYLDMLQTYGFNLSRIIVLLRETESEFKGYLGYQNTLCPTRENYVGPWKRSNIPGCRDGGNKFDLDEWNEEYFCRLRDFCSKAAERGIIVEITFFSQYYNNKPDGPWSLSPLNPENNVNGIGPKGYSWFTSCENESLLVKQEELVKKVVMEMRGFDNIYYEICNEPPYPEGGDPAEMPEDHPHAAGEAEISHWQNQLADLIHGTEAPFEHQHMIAVCDPHASIQLEKFSICNYHYMPLADAGLKALGDRGKALALDETLTGIVSWNREMDFDGRRKEAWEFLMRGGCAYDYLDFTIAACDPRGEGKAEFPGGIYYDGTMMRYYLKYLLDFFTTLDFVQMSPDDTIVKNLPGTAKAFTLAEKGKTYGVYINGSALKYLTIELPEGEYLAQWYSPVTGDTDLVAKNITGGGDIVLELPLYHSDIALKLTAC